MMLSPSMGLLISSSPARLPNSWTHPIGMGDDMSLPPEPVKPAAECLPAAGCFPSWCSWLPFADFADACKVPTQAQQEAYARTQMERNKDKPGYSQAVVDEALTDLHRLDDALCAENPEHCAEYKAASANPTCSSIFGPGSPLCDPKGPFTLSMDKWLILGAAGIAALILTKR